MYGRAALVALALLTFLIPLGLAQEEEPLCIIVFTPSADFRHVEVVQDLVTTDAEREALLRAADADGDGNVSAAEVDAYETSTRNATRIGEATGSGGERRMVRDGDVLPSLLVWTDLQGAEGPVGNRTFKVAEVREYDFGQGTREAVAHRFEGGAAASYEPRPVIETVIVDAPPGWRVWRVNDGEHLASSVTVRGLDLRATFVVDFIKDGADPATAGFGEPLKGGSAAGVAFVAGAVALGAFALGGRRR